MRFIEIEKERICFCQKDEHCTDRAEYAIRCGRGVVVFCHNHALDELTKLLDIYDNNISYLITEDEEKNKDTIKRFSEERKRCEDAINEISKM